VTLDYPLKWEVASLYPREVAVAARAIAVIDEARKVRLPSSEAAPLALHFVNAQFGAVEVSTVMEVTSALNEGLEIARHHLGVADDEDSTDTARFITHLRFLISRCMHNTPVAAMAPTVGDALRTSNPREHRIADEIADALERRFTWIVSDDERLYLTLHVARVAQRN
jgi:beta-glucoside operon transcriptional antiterminator